jgi:hypothetical protein
MKKAYLLLTWCIFIYSSSFSQNTTTIRYSANYSCSQKFGMTPSTGDFLMTVEYDDDNLRFNSDSARTMSSFHTVKTTENYVIGKTGGGNYAFYDIKSKQFYFIDYFMSRYMTSGYGKEHSTVKSTTLKMMEMLKEGSTQKDVIQFLCKQADYDF